MTKQAPDLDISFVVPTYCEAENLPHLVQHIKDGLADSGLTWELIIANDESGDATATVCAELARQDPVRLLNRTTDRGLALAVIDGVRLVAAEFVVIMDADLSHPASLVPRMIELLRTGPARFVIGSRNVASASTDAKWPVLRHIGTFCATALARPLVKVRDPMAGFFALRRSDWPTTGLRPIGYKIGLEIIVRTKLRPEQVVELPIYFADRKYGESKMGLRELHNYLHHLLNLYRFRWPIFRFFLHSAVGTVGLLIDAAGYLALQQLGVNHLGARLIAYWPATVNNWWLNRFYTYDDRPRRRPLVQLIEFCQVSLLGFAVNGGVYYLLTKYITFFDQQRLWALVIGVIAGLLVNYVGSNLRVFGRHHDRPKSSS